MFNLPPAEVRPVTAAEIQRMGGIPVYQTGTRQTRIVGACFEDMAYPLGWKPAPLIPSLKGCARPDLTKRTGQEWQKRLNVSLNTPSLPVVAKEKR